MGWRELTVEQFLRLRNPLVIDVRSPCEHTAEHVPGSVNVPLLSDEERAVVGIIYKEVGEVVARRHALKLIAPKIPTLIDDIVALRTQHSQATVVYCWRGGLRSESVASLLSMAGIDCFRLQGGYKSWRANVLRDFQTDQYRFVPVILHGLTGVGKTEILKQLSARNLHVLDLEEIACHRGSAFGSMGLAQQPSQKNFDALVWKKLREVDADIVFMEAESRKIGRISLPDFIYKRILSGVPVLITGSIEKRIERIISDYLSACTREQLDEALSHLADLKERLGAARVKQVKDVVLSGDLHSAVHTLLTDYYDPLYSKQIQNHSPFQLEVSGDDPAAAAEKIVFWSQSLRGADVLQLNE